ncbi:IMPACT family protein [Selenomonas artemidis]|uniref:IMPACT family protein n=1 Tax=Selenomonas artemidis TaxID=671224 RepID=UPI0023F469DD|nr:YigZ family protein [Selenomonas artemidis]
MTIASYITVKTGETPIAGVSPVAYEIERSRFLSYVRHAEEESSVRVWLEEIRKKHFDARHTPYAFVCGASADRQRSSDDGEPGGTAGSPILAAIKARSITNTAVAVVRYFGGIKLGAGGLIRAYAHAAGLGLDAAAKVRMTPLRTLRLHIGYDLLSSVERYIRDAALHMGDAVYTDTVTLTLLLPPEECDTHARALTDRTAGRAVFEWGETSFAAVPLP